MLIASTLGIWLAYGKQNKAADLTDLLGGNQSVCTINNRRKGDRKLQTKNPEVNSLVKAYSKWWRQLCASYLPVTTAGSLWQYSREDRPGDLEQGWKLHLSASVLTACKVMQRVTPILQREGVLYKAPTSLQVLEQINCGLSYGYSQIGKFISLYPQSDDEALFLAHRVHQLTRGFIAPAVPFDLRFKPDSCVYYRYGAFHRREVKNPDGTLTSVIRHPQGYLIPDERERAKPDWISDPFIGKRVQRKSKSVATPLKTTFRAFRALTQRGKGGVYQALDLSVQPPRLCVLKEGRKAGEVSWDGRDGYWRVRNEEQVLRHLQAMGINVPHVYSSFEVEGNYYLVTEFLDGDNLQVFLKKRQRRLTISQVLQFGLQLSLYISQIHAAGWVWRDCKPGNLMVMPGGELRPLDFEGACPIAQPDLLTWNTPEFAPPECQKHQYAKQSRAPEDLYGLGATIYFLLTGRVINAASPVSITKWRRNVPSPVCALVSELLASEPALRPSAQTAAARFKAALNRNKLIFRSMP